VTKKNSDTKRFSQEIVKLVDQIMSSNKSSTSDRTLIKDNSRKAALSYPNFRDMKAPIKLTDPDFISARSGRRPQEKSFDKKSMPKPRVAFVYDEAKKLRHECPDIDQVKARKRINSLLEKNHYKSYSRTQFNRITEDLEFPPARRGRKPSK
jgi:PHP family Zn ribbon phosphoesterase